MTKVKATNSSGSTHSNAAVENDDNSEKSPPMVQSSCSKNGTGKSKGVRCQVCRKKLGIACRYQCRCGLTFCSTHRYPETHECTFDYKTEGRNKIRENNPVVVAKKIQEI